MESRTTPYAVGGRITNLQQNALENLVVKAFSIDSQLKSNRIGKDVSTDRDGLYVITFFGEEIRERNDEKGPNVFICVYDGEKLLGKSDVYQDIGLETRIDLEVAIATNSQDDTFSVSGTVKDAGDALLSNVVVVAFDHYFRKEQELDRKEIKDGQYKISFTRSQLVRPENPSASLSIKVYSPNKELIGSSPILHDAPRHAIIDIIIPADQWRPLSYYARIEETTAPLLGEIPYDELEVNGDNNDISFLAGNTKLPLNDIGRFAMAHRMATESLPAQFWFAILRSFYEFRQDIRIGEQEMRFFNSLPTYTVSAASKAIGKALNNNDISNVYRDLQKEWLTAFQELILRQTAENNSAPFASPALDHAGIDDSWKRNEFARLFIEHNQFNVDLITELKKNERFSRSEIDDLQTSFQIFQLTQADFSVTRAIRKSFDITRPDKIRMLAKLTENDWVDFVRENQKSNSIKIPLENDESVIPNTIRVAETYGKMLSHQFRDAYPTAAFAGGLERAMQEREIKELQHARPLVAFIDRHEDFELLTTSIDDFFDNKTHDDFKGLVKDDSFRMEVKAVQRIYKLIPDFDATANLLADRLHSAQQVYRIGQSEFVRRYSTVSGFTESTARKAWARAADTTAAVVSIVGDLKALETEGLPLVLQNNNADLSQFPNWNNLFQQGDLCECEHCRSVVSPAAYFADLLMFLKNRRAINPAQTVKDILFQRRADLGYIELNCENAMTPLPYVDVVCEVLERVVAAGENDVELLGFGAVPAGSAAAKAAVSAALVAQNLNPGIDFTLSQVSPSDPNRWVVHGDEITYLLKKKGTPNFFVEILCNTKGTSAELLAYPQYVNPKAYEKLKKAKFPLTLPFDLFAEEVRSAFSTTQLQRWDLMRTLHGAAAPNNPSAGAIASEYFGISIDTAATFDEKRLMLVSDATVAGQKAVWGVSGAAWLSAVGNVKYFLSATSLEYNDLLILLDLKYINPAGDIIINHLDPSCDTDKKVIQVLDEIKLDRIHRFLRLFRKVNKWKMWELDMAIRHVRLGNGTLDEGFLINLFYFEELRKKLGGKLTIEQGLSLFGDLPVETHFTELHHKRTNSLYQNLFLNKQLIKPLDTAYEIANVAVAPPTVEKISMHQPVLLAALGIREADLALYRGLTKPTTGLPYITDDLTLSNISFLWRQAWLAKTLKFKAEDWKTILTLINVDLPDMGTPQSAYELIEKILFLKASGYSADELNWILLANRTAKAASKETDTTRFLNTLRKDLQTIQKEYNPAQYPFLTTTPPTDIDGLTGLLTTSLQKLGRDEQASQFFFGTLSNDVNQEIKISDLPSGFGIPPSVTGAPNNIPINYETALYYNGVMTAAQRNTLLTDASLAAVSANPSYQQAIQDLFQQPGRVLVANLPAGFVFPAIITGAPNNLPIRYEPVIRFTGLMTTAAQAVLLGDPALAAVTGIASYQEAIDIFFTTPRLAMKFLEPIFSTTLKNLPAAVDFKSLPNPALVSKVSYDGEQKVLRFSGILSKEEKSLLDTLSADVPYRNAVNSLYTQPRTILPPDQRIWLMDADLKFPLRDLVNPANDNLAGNLAVAITKALAYLSKTLSENAVVRQSSTQLGITETLTRRIFENYSVLPGTLMIHFTTVFVATSGVIDYTTLKPTFDAWFWAVRVSVIWKKGKISFTEWEKIGAITPAAQLLDFASLPLDAAGVTPSWERFLRTIRLLKMRDTLPENSITLLEVMENLNAGSYATIANFSADVEKLNEEWTTADVDKLVNAIDIPFPAGFLLQENWERLRKSFYFLTALNGQPDTIKIFAADSMSSNHAKTVKELLRSKFGTETWTTLSTEIQNKLRERKRDALDAYLLTLPKPADAPSGKWENNNDLYSYYLLDVEMCSCQTTSRLVQGSGSIQLFVQRCHMGLEPNVKVIADGATGDSAWRWWKWMRKYRPWQANCEVWLWPENLTEPELKKDLSPFFHDLKNELLQGEINQFTVETAFVNYLEKTDSVKNLEIAGFYHEDDGDNAILHVFGRTTGAEPHLYHYRTYDYRQWTPWTKVDVDIKGDYLIPMVINKRVFLAWPIISEINDESANSTVTIPKAPGSTESNFTPKKTSKRLKVQMAVTDLRQGKWTSKRVSKEFAVSEPFTYEIAKHGYKFFAVDRTETDGKFGIWFSGYSYNTNNLGFAFMRGGFEVSGCMGVPEKAHIPGDYDTAIHPESDSTGGIVINLKWLELGVDTARLDAPENDFTLQTQFADPRSYVFTTLLQQTPWLFKVSTPWHLSYFDKLVMNGQALFTKPTHDRVFTPAGTWLPFFYADKKRTFFVLPTLGGQSRETKTMNDPGSIRYYYPDIKKVVRKYEDDLKGVLYTWVDTINFSALNPDERQKATDFLRELFPEEDAPPYSDEQLKQLVRRWMERIIHLLLGAWTTQLYQSRQFHFKNFYHPFVCDFLKLVNNPLKGIPALMTREVQLKNSGFKFKQSYQPTPWVIQSGTDKYYPKEICDFSPDGSYTPYFQENFIFVPLFIANTLSKNQRFEEARDWYHYIFNPLGVESSTPGGSAMSKYWITKPFFETTDPQYVKQRIDNILRMIAGDTTVPGYSPQAKKDLEDQVLDWRNHPFEPHRIANYRPVAYQKYVVMKYLDNLIAWGDYLFRQDSMESINECTQLYVLASEILGPKPKRIPPRVQPPVESFNELEEQFDVLSNALVEVENLVPVTPGSETYDTAPPLPMLYFCIPHNEKMLKYWDTVADRLYKIRHCMNIEGVVRQLALFEPPIDPALLVKAVASGIDISAALSELNAPLPMYRFQVILQKANELCNDVKTLGAALLSALEKRDAEEMARLRQNHEIRMLESVKSVKLLQVEEATNEVIAAQQAQQMAQIKQAYYGSREFMSAGEIAATVLSAASIVSQTAGTIADVLAGAMFIIPDFHIGASGFGGSPHFAAKTGGTSIGKSTERGANGLYNVATILEKSAALASSIAGHQRRKDDWDFQKLLADKEDEQAKKSIDIKGLRLSASLKELDNQTQQIEQARDLDTHMRSKYTNQELYQWQIGQLSGVYFQSYQLAFELARRAERCYRFELGVQDSSYITAGQWDGLKNGLLSGDKLQFDLRRLETAYMEQNAREFELSKTVSLLSIDPLALIKLRETGRCFFKIPEEIFDLDFPGHYFRRIKTVSILIPSVAGPYITLSCTLRLLKNSIRINTTNGDNGYPHNTDDNGLPTDDKRFIENNIPFKAIACSGQQNESGVFELNYKDDRYLPFEGAGVISEWSLELLNDLPSNNPDPANPDFGRPLRQLDFNSFGDALVTFKFTSREDAGVFKNSAFSHLRDYYSQDGGAPSFRTFKLREEFPGEWARFLNPTNPAAGNVFDLTLSSIHFPMKDSEKTIQFNSIWILSACSDPGNYSIVFQPPLPPPPPAGSDKMTLAKVNAWGNLHFANKDTSQLGIQLDPLAPPVTWQLAMQRPGGGNLQLDPLTNEMEVEEIIIVLGYGWV